MLHWWEEEKEENKYREWKNKAKQHPEIIDVDRDLEYVSDFLQKQCYCIYKGVLHSSDLFQYSKSLSTAIQFFPIVGCWF